MRALLVLLVALSAAAPAGARADSSSVAPAPAPTRARMTRPIVDVITEADSLVKARGGARADHARLLLSWRAPWGERGAVTELAPALGDTSAIDTLYLCMQPGRNSPTFNGFSATLEFHCAPGDTLGDFWHFERTGANAGSLGVQFGPDPSFPVPQPWKVGGTGRPSWVPTSSGAQLKLVFAVPYTEAAPVDSATIYALGRVIIRHRRAALSGSAQPMCIEWREASLAFAMRDEPVVRRGERFAAWSLGGADACGTARGVGRPAGWKPGGKRPR